ncbi:MAG: VPDSG-CTERM sorting domain-containing protein [Acidobacteria bacterium]|nr:VPDSG-CTERM sorting domain-containing protein [Acidobacteriota bacterium]
MRKIALAAAMALSLTASAAYAGPIVPAQSGPGNDVIGDGVWGYLNANVYLAGGPAYADVTYVGKEAGNTNTFSLTGASGSVNYSTASTGVGTTTNVLLNSGLINFSFTTNNPAATVFNGANVLPSSGGINFFVTFQLPGNPTSGQEIWLALDDQGAPDDNHDDMVIKIKLTNGGSFSVPDGGATLSLLGGALMGLGYLRRRLSL